MNFFQRKNIKNFINYFLGPLLFIWLSYSIYRQIKNQTDLAQAWGGIRESLNSKKIWNLIVVMLLMILNWSIESVKWKLSVKKIQEVSFIRAFKAVLSGVSFSVSTPNRMGEYLGRILYMDEGNRLKTVSTTIVGSISQLIITLLMGCIGLLILLPKIQLAGMLSSPWNAVLFYGVLATLIVLTLFYFRLSWLVKWVDRFSGNSRYVYLVRSLEDFDTTILLQLMFLSALRFFVFIIQYYLMFRLFEVNVTWWQGFWATSVSFLVLAIIPTFAIAELGLRGKVTLSLLGLFSANGLGITITAGTIWLINLVIPAIIGSLLILGIKKIFKAKHERT
ncbi:MAG TPA: lysylphosphatidylglycerol synthase transmembrane domain-containing protein [Chitinophagaceae bacterium]|nr:lysylphosphatidylglycerol synthase transmembrane domain-containing protein [Chitinophagaceae bacterium]